MLKNLFFITALLPFSIIVNLNYAHANDAGKEKIKQLFQKLSESNSDTSEVTSLLHISQYFMQINTDSFLIYSKKAYHLSKTCKYRQINATMNLASAYGMTDDFENSIKYYIEAMHEAEKHHDEKNYAVILSGIGTNYLYLKDFTSAFKYFSKSLEISKNYRGKIVSLVNLGQVCASIGDKVKYKEAYNFYTKALKLAEEAKNDEDQAVVYNRIGELFLMEEDYDQSILYLEKSLKILADKEPRSYYRVVGMKNLTENYILTGHYEKGIKLAKIADSLAREGGFMFEQQTLTLLLSEIYDSLRKPALAYDYFRKYSSIKDSLFNIEKNKHISYMQTEFETRQHETEARHLRERIAFNKRMNMVYIALSFLIIITLFYFIKNIKQKVKILKYEQEKLIQQKEKEKIEKQMLEYELDKKNREILTQILQNNQQGELFTSMLSEVNNIIKLEEPWKMMDYAKQLTIDINKKIDLSNDWDKIKFHFEEVHPDFFNHLKSNYPDLSINDLKFIAYTKMKFSNKDIARLLNINSGSVQVSRYRLKKKMNIPEEVNFIDFLANIE